MILKFIMRETSHHANFVKGTLFLHFQLLFGTSRPFRLYSCCHLAVVWDRFESQLKILVSGHWKDSPCKWPHAHLSGSQFVRFPKEVESPAWVARKGFRRSVPQTGQWVSRWELQPVEYIRSHQTAREVEKSTVVGTC